MDPRKIVVTGGPSTGKTSVIQSLGQKGFPCFHEISRNVTLEAREQGIPQLFVSDPVLFSERIMEGRIKQFREATRVKENYVFLDRGLPDVIAYMACFGQAYGNSFVEACESHVYDDVFLLPPWKEIHTPDNERYEDFEDTLRIHDFLEETYQSYGYNVVHVPKGSVEERLVFILKELNIL